MIRTETKTIFKISGLRADVAVEAGELHEELFRDMLQNLWNNQPKRIFLTNRKRKIDSRYAISSDVTLTRQRIISDSVHFGTLPYGFRSGETKFQVTLHHLTSNEQDLHHYFNLNATLLYPSLSSPKLEEFPEDPVLEDIMIKL